MIFSVPKLSQDDRRVLAEIEGFRDEVRHQIATPRRWTGLLRRSLVARGIQGSNSIEGIQVTLPDAEAAVADEPPVETDEATWAEIVGYRTALTYVQQLSGTPEFVYHHMLLNALHFMMQAHRLPIRPGQFRTGGIFVSDATAGEIAYTGPDAELVPGLMSELVDWLNAGDLDAPTLVRAAVAHLNLTSIHPWRDGNGRMSRCLQTLVIARGSELAPEFSSIEEWLGTGRNTWDYYDALRAVQHGVFEPRNDSGSWVRFCLRAHHLQAQLVQHRLVTAAALWRELERLADERGLPGRTVSALYAAATAVRLRRTTYQHDEALSLDQAGRDLRQLVQSGLLAQQGETRSRFYLPGPPVVEVRERIASGTAAASLTEPYR
jgi:Fic family protein